MIDNCETDNLHLDATLRFGRMGYVLAFHADNAELAHNLSSAIWYLGERSYPASPTFRHPPSAFPLPPSAFRLPPSNRGLFPLPLFLFSSFLFSSFPPSAIQSSSVRPPFVLRFVRHPSHLHVLESRTLFVAFKTVTLIRPISLRTTPPLFQRELRPSKRFTPNTFTWGSRATMRCKAKAAMTKQRR